MPREIIFEDHSDDLKKKKMRVAQQGRERKAEVLKTLATKGRSTVEAKTGSGEVTISEEELRELENDPPQEAAM